MLNKITFFFQISIIKTIYLNLKYFCIKDALKLPIWVYSNTKIEKAEGQIVCECPIKRGIISIGKPGLGNRLHTIWLVSGKIVFHGNVNFGSGTKISVGRGATLSIGKNFSVTGDTSIICKKHVNIGDNSILSWDCLIMDTDYHHIYDDKGVEINKPSPIFIGDNVWIACRTTILKGSKISNGSIIACSALITSDIDTPNSIIGGENKLKFIRENIRWKA